MQSLNRPLISSFYSTLMSVVKKRLANRIFVRPPCNRAN